MNQIGQEPGQAVITTPAEDIESLSREDILIEESALVEAWLERTISDIYQRADSLGLGLKHGKDGALKVSGIDRNTLLAKGFQPHQVDMFYRTLYAQSAGSYLMLKEGCGINIDAEDFENVLKVLRILSGHVQKYGVEPLVSHSHSRNSTLGDASGPQGTRLQTSRVFAVATAEIVAYSQLKVQREQLYRKLSLSREKRKKLEESVINLAQQNEKYDKQMRQRDEELERMKKEILELKEGNTRLVNELQSTKTLLATTGDNMELKSPASQRAELRDVRSPSRMSTSETTSIPRESRCERKSRVVSPPSRQSTPNSPDFEERLASAEKSTAEYREENRQLVRRSTILSELYQQEAATCAALKIQLEDMQKQGTTTGSSMQPLPGRRGTRLGSSVQLTDKRGVAERRKWQSLVDQLVTEKLNTTDAEYQVLIQKYEELKKLMDLQAAECEELRKALEVKESEHRLLTVRCETLMDLADSKTAVIEELNTKVTELSSRDELMKSLEAKCEEYKLILDAKNSAINNEMKIDEDSKAKIAKVKYMEDQCSFLIEQLKDAEVLASVTENKRKMLEQECEAQKLRNSQLEVLEHQIKASEQSGALKDKEFKELNKELNEVMVNCLELNEKVEELNAQAEGSHRKIGELQEEVENLKQELLESKSKEKTSPDFREELEEEGFETKETDESGEREERLAVPLDSHGSSNEIHSELRQTQKKHKILQNKYDKLEAELNFLKTRKGEIFKLHAMLSDAKSDLRKRSEDSSRLLGELNSQRHEMERLRAEKESKNKSLSRALHRLSSTDSEQAKVQEELANILKEMTKLKGELSSSRAELAASQTELSQMRNQAFRKESEILDLHSALEDVRAEEENKLENMIRRRTAVMKSLINDMNVVQDCLQVTGLDIEIRMETGAMVGAKGNKCEEDHSRPKNPNSRALNQSSGIDKFPIKFGAQDLSTEIERPAPLENPTEQAVPITHTQDVTVHEAVATLDKLDQVAEETAKAVNEAALRAIDMLKNVIYLKSVHIKELQLKIESGNKKVVQYASTLPTLVDLMWTIWNHATLTAKVLCEISLRATKLVESTWTTFSISSLCKNEVYFQFVELLKVQEEATAMTRLEAEAGMALKFKMDLLSEQIAISYVEDLSGLVSNYQHIASNLESQIKELLPDIAMNTTKPIPQGVVFTDMYHLLEAQKKITTWQSAVQVEIRRLNAKLSAERVERKWKDKYVSDILQKYMKLAAKNCVSSLLLEWPIPSAARFESFKNDIPGQLGKLANTEFISRPVQTSWTDMWSLFNDSGTKEPSELPDHFASYWEKLLLYSKDVKPLSEKSARQTIMNIYAAKVKDDYANVRSKKSPHEMPEFVYLYFQDQFGRSPRGEEKLMEFMATIITNQNQTEIFRFGLTAGMVRDVHDESTAVLPPESERIPVAPLVTQLPVTVSVPRLPLGELQLPQKLCDALVEDVWKRDRGLNLPPIIPPGLPSTRSRHEDFPDLLSLAHQQRKDSKSSVTAEHISTSHSVVPSPRICNPNILTPKSRSAGVVLAPLPETAIGSPRWRAKQVRFPLVKDTKLLGMTNEELAHPLAEHLVEWKDIFGSPAFSLNDLQHPMTEDSTEIIFRNSGVQDMLNKFSSEQFLNSAGNVDLGVPITGKQLPQLHALLYQACEAIDVEVPYMYVRDSPYCRAYLWCPKFKRPSLIFNSALFDILDPFELQVVMAQQMATYKYPKYRLLAMAWTVLILAPTTLEQVPRAAESLPQRATHNLRAINQIKEKVMLQERWPICSTVVNGLDRWIRFADLVGDRAAYYVCRNVSTVVSANMKMAAGSPTLAGQLNVDALLEMGHLMDAAVHAEELHEAFRLGPGFEKPVKLHARSEPSVPPADNPRADHMERKVGNLGVELRALDLLKSSHSLVVLRARELQRWVQEKSSRLDVGNISSGILAGG